MESDNKNINDIKSNISPNMPEGSNSEYIRVLEMNLQLLEKEVEHLRMHLKPKTGEQPAIKDKSLAENDSYSSSKFHSSRTAKDVLSILQEQLNNQFSIVECSIFFFNSSRILEPAYDDETSLNLGNNLKQLEEQGIIDWSLERNAPTVIPNISTSSNILPEYFLLAPLYLRGNAEGIFIAGTSREMASFSEKELKDISILIDYASIALDNIRSSEQISRMNKSLSILSKQMFQSARISSLGELSVAITHEILNPMKIIKANLHLIESGMGDTVRRFDIINEQLKHVDIILNRLLNYSEAFNSETKPAKVNLSDLIDEVLLFTDTQLQSDNIIVEKEIEDNKILIQGFKSQIAQVFLTIILNSRDFMPEGGKLSISLSKIKDRKVVINFTDSGIGISEEDLKHIFEPFYTIQTSNKSFGMGLFITKNIVEQHKGIISVFSEQGKGMTFKLIFPIFVERKLTEQLFEEIH